MKNNTANNQTAPGGKMPGARIYKTRLINPKGKEVIEHIVGAARGMVESMPREQLEGIAGAILSELLLAQIMDVSEITVKRLNELLCLVGVIVKVSGQKGGNPDRDGKMNPECVAALGNVQTAGDQIKYLPRFCRLYDLPKHRLVPAGKRPQQRNPAPMAEKWNPSHGENRNVPVCGSAHDPEKNKIKLGILNN